MKVIFNIILLALAVLFTFCFWFLVAKGATIAGATSEEWIRIYQSNARTPIFSGFLTIGSFLLALKTNILARIKEVYDSDDYRTIYRAEKKINPRLRYYGSLERLGGALGINVKICILTSVLQMTLGFVAAPWAFAVCCGVALTGLALLFYITNILMVAHRDWFDMQEKSIQIKILALDEKNSL